MPLLQLIGFIVRSLRASFRGEKLAHILTVTTVCLSLMLVGAVYLLKVNLSLWADSWASQVSVSVFVRSDIEESQRTLIDKRLKQEVHLRDLTWTAPEAAAGELADLLGLQGSRNLTAFAPWIAEGRRSPATDLEALDKLAGSNQVLYVDNGTVVAEQLQNIARRITQGGLFVVLFLLLGAFIVVSNTVGLALNSRRDEVEIMDLVGTPLEWIYAAYLAEGLLLGLTGALTSVLLLQAGVSGLHGPWLASFGVAGLTGFSPLSGGLLVALGGAIGFIGSAVSIRRFLAS